MLAQHALADGAASVREVTGGDETVPTVIAADRSFINPDVAVVRGLLFTAS